jgi:hypothetical protein
VISRQKATLVALDEGRARYAAARRQRRRARTAAEVVAARQTLREAREREEQTRERAYDAWRDTAASSALGATHLQCLPSGGMHRRRSGCAMPRRAGSRRSRSASHGGDPDDDGSSNRALQEGAW